MKWAQFERGPHISHFSDLNNTPKVKTMYIEELPHSVGTQFFILYHFNEILLT